MTFATGGERQKANTHKKTFYSKSFFKNNKFIKMKLFLKLCF